MKIFELLEDRNDIIQSPEFKRWFGDSKVVDKDGKPLVVYHGAGSDFAAFSEREIGSATDAGLLGAGFYFTTNSDLAGTYADQSAGFIGGKANVIPAYLSIQKPFFSGSGSAPLELMYRIAGKRPKNMSSPEGKAWAEKLRNGLIARGYDGIIDSSGDAIYANEIVVFRPEQIKSAIGNVGKFDPNNPDITKEELNESVNVPGSNNTLPPEPGSTKIPNGTVRLYHQTDETNLESIARNGLNIQYARGIEGPRAIYASKTGFYGKPEKTPTVEFYVDIDKWDDPFVLQDVPTEQIIAVHYPWHKQARYILDHQDTLKNTLNGEFDDLDGDYAKAVDYVKTVYKNTKL